MSNDTPSTFTLPRSGDTPVTFEGVMVFSDDSSRTQGGGENRYHEVALFRTGKGRYVVLITYVSRWAGEESQDSVLVCDSVPALRRAIHDYSPIPPNIGYPDRTEYAYKQARMIQDLQVRFDKLVSDMLMSVADEVAERID